MVGHQWQILHAKLTVNKMGLKPMEETNTKMEEEEEMVWCKDKRQEKDLYKLWNRHNGVHPSIDKIWGCKKKL